MPTYIVKNALKTGDKPDKGYGPMQTIALTLQEYGQAEEIAAEWYTKATNAVPALGSQLEGDVEPSQYGNKFKKAKAGGFGGRGGRSPEESKSITRQHSQHMALLYVQLRHAQGKLPDGFGLNDDLRKIIDWFDTDAHSGWRRTSTQPLPAASQPSDVPNNFPPAQPQPDADPQDIPF